MLEYNINRTRIITFSVIVTYEYMRMIIRETKTGKNVEKTGNISKRAKMYRIKPGGQIKKNRSSAILLRKTKRKRRAKEKQKY